VLLAVCRSLLGSKAVERAKTLPADTGPLHTSTSFPSGAGDCRLRYQTLGAASSDQSCIRTIPTEVDLTLKCAGRRREDC
jgi:hypothetical protein